MARAPFGTELDLSAWTGDRMLVTDWSTGRTASYDPAADRWRTRATAPHGVGSGARDVWTGRELVIVEVADDGPGLSGLAYEGAEDRWRELAPRPAASDGLDHGLARPVWTGSHVIVVDAPGSVSAYDPATDSWLELPPVPGDGTAWAAYWTGSEVLVESRSETAGVTMAVLDPVAGTWSEPIPGPLDIAAVRSGGTWIDGRVMYVSWSETDDEATGAWNAAFDPSTRTWSTFEHDCDTNAYGRTVAAGELLVANDARRALDSRSFACTELPAPPRPTTVPRWWCGPERTSSSVRLRRPDEACATGWFHPEHGANVGSGRFASLAVGWPYGTPTPRRRGCVRNRAGGP